MRESTTSQPMRRKLRHLHVRRRRLHRFALAARASFAPKVARATELALAAAAYALLPVWPLVAATAARDASYAVRYGRTVLRVVRHIHGAVRGRSVSRYIVQKLAPRRVEPERVSGACTHCGNCCLYGGCVYLAYDAHGRSTCRIYGGRLWKMLACGEYPANAREIGLYGCASFTATPATGTTPRVIPIVLARRPRVPERVRAAPRSRAGN